MSKWHKLKWQSIGRQICRCFCVQRRENCLLFSFTQIFFSEAYFVTICTCNCQFFGTTSWTSSFASFSQHYWKYQKKWKFLKNLFEMGCHFSKSRSRIYKITGLFSSTKTLCKFFEILRGFGSECIFISHMPLKKFCLFSKIAETKIPKWHE